MGEGRGHRGAEGGSRTAHTAPSEFRSRLPTGFPRHTEASSPRRCPQLPQLCNGATAAPSAPGNRPAPPREKGELAPPAAGLQPTRSSSHFGFGLLYRPHVTRPAGSSLLPRPALRPFPALGRALPAPRPPPSRAAPSSPSPSPPSRAVPAPSPRQPFLRDASPPPAAVPPPRLPSPRPELTVSKMAAVSVWGISAVRPGAPGTRRSSLPA